jgi:hypothetical protein
MAGFEVIIYGRFWVIAKVLDFFGIVAVLFVNSSTRADTLLAK